VESSASWSGKPESYGSGCSHGTKDCSHDHPAISVVNKTSEHGTQYQSSKLSHILDTMYSPNSIIIVESPRAGFVELEESVLHIGHHGGIHGIKGNTYQV
jgi:hypothetical protein